MFAHRKKISPENTKKLIGGKENRVRKAGVEGGLTF